MTRRGLLARLDTARVESTIAEAERASTGEIRVSIAGVFWGRSRRLAERAFVRLGMDQTRDRNAVLILVVPWRRKLVVLGDAGIAARVTDDFWAQVVSAATVELRAGRFTEGLCAAVSAVGRVLSEHFPCPAEGDNADELPNRIDRDERPKG